MEAYRPDEKGGPLLELLKENWLLFENTNLTSHRANELLADILENTDVTARSFIPAMNQQIGTSNQWDVFREELMCKNRFFPDEILDSDRLTQLLQLLALEKDEAVLHKGEAINVWYRARIQKDGHPYELADMGAPPPNLAPHGRANPVGIPYLYLASTQDTAVSEIRPQTGERATVAAFSIPEGLKILDLRHPRKTASPFRMLADDDEMDVSLLHGNFELLERLGQELTRPVLPKSVAIDYLPSQYLCEFIKKRGYDGVLYRSSVSDGVNIALFDPARGRGLNVTQHLVSRVTVEIRPD
jgi:hypothetical protein